MLKNISALISPDMLKTLMEMGHGDEIVFADANFPAASCAQRLIRADGLSVSALLEAILPIFPLDIALSPEHAVVMLPENGASPPVWGEYEQRLTRYEPGSFLCKTQRKDFYLRAHKAYAVVATGETALFGNLILRKGTVG